MVHGTVFSPWGSLFSRVGRTGGEWRNHIKKSIMSGSDNCRGGKKKKTGKGGQVRDGGGQVRVKLRTVSLSSVDRGPDEGDVRAKGCRRRGSQPWGHLGEEWAKQR